MILQEIYSNITQSMFYQKTCNPEKAYISVLTCIANCPTRIYLANNIVRWKEID